MTLDEVADKLDDLGPGSSAMVASSWTHGGAHAYNAVNDAGTIRWVDGQLGRVGPWPPVYGAQVDESLVIVFGPDGVPR